MLTDSYLTVSQSSSLRCAYGNGGKVNWIHRRKCKIEI